MTGKHQHEGEILTDGEGRSWYSCCGEATGTGHVAAGDNPVAAELRAALAVPDDRQIMALLESRALPVVAWAQALLQNTEFDEAADSNPELDMVAAILAAESSQSALAVTSMRTALDLLGDKPGAHSGLLRIHGATPLRSTFDDGPPCFAVVSVEDVASGEQYKLTIGARSVQAVILAHTVRGWLPFDCILTRRLKATRAGFYPLNLEAGG